VVVVVVVVVVVAVVAVVVRPGFDVCPPLQRHSFRNGANVLQIAVFRG